MPSADEVSALADHCLMEATNRLGVPSAPLEPGAIAGSPGQEGLRLDRIHDIRGVNALGEQATLELADADLTIVFGPNGSGKSGYARLLKHLCGARLAGPMHGNVFTDGTSAQSASVVIRDLGATTSADVTSTLQWEAINGALAQLKSVPVFDTDTSVEYGDSATPATHAPRSMALLKGLIDVADAVRAHLRERIGLLICQLPAVPADLAHTHAAGALRMILRVNPSEAAVEAACAISDDERTERVDLEAALALPNPADHLRKVVAEKARLSALNASVLERVESWGDAKASEIISARGEAAAKRTAATAHASAFFSEMPLQGVGERGWRELWSAAEAYSSTLAYPDHPHPNVGDDARCVLCQQALDGDAKARLQGFAEFVQGRLQAEATAAEGRLEALIQNLPGVPDAPTWSSMCQAIDFNPDQSEALRAAIEKRTAAMRNMTDVAGTPAVDWTGWHAAMTAKVSVLDGERERLAQLVDESGRKQSQARLLELRAKEWLATQLDAVRAEVRRQKEVEAIEGATKLAFTHALTAKNNAIAEAEIAKGFCDRFDREMQRLGGQRLPVVMTPKAEGKGHYTFSARLKDSQRAMRSQEVLSEGERRVIALAAFLADATGSDRALPVVFDDPISSLDQRFEEAVAVRIAELAESRQVVVFTHRLSLMVLLKAAVRKRAEFHGGRARANVLSIAREGTATGVPATIDAFSMMPREGLDKVKRDAREAEKHEGEIRRVLLRNACSNFRVLVERAVEEHLLFGMVLRYRREVKTMGHLKRLTAIRLEDCELIDGMMSKYSAFEHSQPMETPVWLPEADELIADAELVHAWIKPFMARADDVAKGKVSVGSN